MTTKAKPPRWRVEGAVVGLGIVQHILRAATSEKAKIRFRRAHPRHHGRISAKKAEGE